MIDYLIREHIRPWLREPGTTRDLWTWFYWTAFPASFAWWLTGGFLSPIFWLFCLACSGVVGLAILRLEP